MFLRGATRRSDILRFPSFLSFVDFFICFSSSPTRERCREEGKGREREGRKGRESMRR